MNFTAGLPVVRTSPDHGTAFEIAGKGFINWSRGDYVWWRNGVPHFAGNIGTEPRYTMQITGTKYEKD